MKERPILFKAEMVRAIIDGRKTQTRRLVKHQHLTTSNDLDTYFGSGTLEEFDAVFFDYPGNTANRICVNCPFGKSGDRLWVRETHCIIREPEEGDFGKVVYKSDGSMPTGGWRSSIHMPRWASRILLEVVSVRVERLNEISEADAIAEGIPSVFHGSIDCETEPRAVKYAELWESINGEKSWAENPWVWVIEFKRVKP